MIEGILNAAKVVMGLGFIIFIHELGHFLAAKKVGIRVLTFSLGFGPRIFGFRKGETDYRVSILPLGGYVRMAGESPGDLKVGDEGEFSSKTVGQRAFVLSAGVIMNILSAFIIFPLAFRLGIPFPEPVIGTVSSGSPAWHAGLEPGDRVLKVNEKNVYKFDDIPIHIALSDAELGVEIVVDRGGETKSFRVYPEKDEDVGLFRIGVGPSYEFRVEPDSPAAEAGLQTGDFPLSIDGTPTNGELGLIVSKLKPDREVKIDVDRDGETHTLDVFTRSKESGFVIGVSRLVNKVGATREGAAGELPFQKDDDILTANDAVIFEPNDLEKAVVAAGAGGTVQVKIERAGREETVEIVNPREGEPEAWVSDIAFVPSEKGTVIRPAPDSPASRAGLQSGDQILTIDGLKVASFEDIVTVMSGYEGGRSLAVTYSRDGQTASTSLSPAPKLETDIGLVLVAQSYHYQESNVLGACRAGIQSASMVFVEVFLVLQKMVTGSVSPKNLGGPVTIVRATSKFADGGFAYLLYFLGILSINLAVFNLLPIPILDGGQLVFLAIEKIKGSPVSEGVLGVFQWAGLIIILALLLFVTFNDIQKM